MTTKSKAVNKPIVLKKNLATKILYWIFQGLTLGTMIASVILLFVSNQQGKETTFNQVFMCLFALFAFNLPLFFERKFKLYIPNYIAIVLYCMIFFHFVLGEVYRAYDSVKIFDKMLHTTSGVIISFISFSIVSMLNSMQRTKIKLSPFFIVLFTFCLTMTSEYLWEIFEYGMDTLFGANMQRWQDSLVLAEGVVVPPATAEGTFVINGPRGNGLLDTMGDMMVNIIGCLGVCIYAYIGMRLKPDWFTARVMLTKKDILALEKEGAVVLDDKVAENLNRPEKKKDAFETSEEGVGAVGNGKALSCEAAPAQADDAEFLPTKANEESMSIQSECSDEQRKEAVIDLHAGTAQTADDSQDKAAEGAFVKTQRTLPDVDGIVREKFRNPR